MLLRYFEAMGRGAPGDLGDQEARRPHEKTIREYRDRRGRPDVGAAADEFQGVLRGVPNFVGPGSGLMGL
jgi:circadian clock protein KaiC